MAYTQTDLDNIDAALLAAAIEGIASCTVAGQTVVSKTTADLLKLRQFVADNISAGKSSGGMRLRTLVPGECG